MTNIARFHSVASSANESQALTAIEYVPAIGLRAGSTIGLFSPSEPVGGGRADRMRRNLETLTAAGYQIVEATYARAISAYTAGTPAERAGDIHDLVHDRNVDALLATWGGKQCNELLPYLDYEAIGQAQKPVLAFSDGCVILNAITSATGLVTFHGPNVAGKLDESSHSDLSTLTGQANTQSVSLSAVFGQTANSHWETWRAGEAEGRLYGGNLSTFTLGLVGTRFLDLDEPVLFFWESLGDRPQILHQHLTCLRNAGWFENVAGMIVGDLMFDPLDPETAWKSRSARDAVLAAIEPYGFPVVQCATFGHRALENPIVPIGGRCALDTAAREARLLEPVLR